MKIKCHTLHNGWQRRPSFKTMGDEYSSGLQKGRNRISAAWASLSLMSLILINMGVEGVVLYPGEPAARRPSQFSRASFMIRKTGMPHPEVTAERTNGTPVLAWTAG